MQFLLYWETISPSPCKWPRHRVVCARTTRKARKGPDQKADLGFILWACAVHHGNKCTCGQVFTEKTHVKSPTKAYPITFCSIFAKHSFIKWSGTNYFIYIYIPKGMKPPRHGGVGWGWGSARVRKVCSQHSQIIFRAYPHLHHLPIAANFELNTDMQRRFWSHPIAHDEMCGFILCERDCSCLWVAMVMTADLLTREKDERARALREPASIHAILPEQSPFFRLPW